MVDAGDRVVTPSRGGAGDGGGSNLGGGVFCLVEGDEHLRLCLTTSLVGAVMAVTNVGLHAVHGWSLLAVVGDFLGLAAPDAVHPPGWSRTVAVAGGGCRGAAR